MKRAALILVSLVVVGGVGWGLWRRGAAPKDGKGDRAKPKAVKVRRGSIRVVVETTGCVVADREVEIKCKASGEVTKLPVDVSDPVRKGDLLVQLDPDDEERSVKLAKINLRVSQAKLAQAKLGLEIAHRNLATERLRALAALKSAEAKAKEAAAKRARVSGLLKKGFSNQEEHDEALSAVAQAESDLEGSRARLEELRTQEVQIASKKQDVSIAEAQVESDKLSLSDAEERLKETTVVSPIDGVVAQRSVQEGQIIASAISNVGGGTTVMKLVDLSRICVLAAVDESDIGRIEVDQRARITVDAHADAVFPGKVVRVATMGVETSNVVTFEVKIEVFGRRRRLLKPQMTANVEILAAERTDVLVVPASAIRRRRRERFVTLQKGQGATEERKVETGVSDGEIVEIVAGLKEGEAVLPGKGGGASRWREGGNEARDARRRSRMRMHMMRGPRRR